MHEDEGFRRYFVYLNLFVFFMLMLVSANSFLLMFVGWEGVGLCSYLLIGFWYQRQAPADAGKKAFVVNRVGDYGFLLGMMLIFVTFGSLDFLKVFPLAHQLSSVWRNYGYHDYPSSFCGGVWKIRSDSRFTYGSLTPWKVPPRSAL